MLDQLSKLHEASQKNTTEAVPKESNQSVPLPQSTADQNKSQVGDVKQESSKVLQESSAKTSQSTTQNQEASQSQSTKKVVDSVKETSQQKTTPSEVKKETSNPAEPNNSPAIAENSPTVSTNKVAPTSTLPSTPTSLPTPPTPTKESPGTQQTQASMPNKANESEKSNLVGKAPELIDISQAKVIFSIYPNTTTAQPQQSDPRTTIQQTVQPQSTSK